MKPRTKLYSLARICALALGISAAAGPVGAADVDPRVNSRENPFACLGGSDALTGGGRTMAETGDELRALLGRIDIEKSVADEGRDDPDRAVDLCVAARLKARLGEGDAGEYFDRAIAASPREPGFELFAGIYYATMRGARRPLLERAERHLYAGLEKLERLRARGEAISFHDTVEDWIYKRLLVLYQGDGQPLLPWKAYKQGKNGLWAPGVSFSTQLRVGQDTRDFFYNSEMRQFTGEANFAASDLRAAKGFDTRDAYDIVRAPRRFEAWNRLRLRHNLIGAVDLHHKWSLAPQSQIKNFYDPNEPGGLADVTVVEYGVGYDRTISLYPLFDVRLAGMYGKGTRQGVIEFEPLLVDEFTKYEVRPSFARFIGPDVLSLDLVYVRLDFSGRPGGAIDDRLRRRDIRAGRIEYALYSPLVLPSSASGELGWQRTATRGIYFYAGAVDDRELWGLHSVVAQDYFGGIRFAGIERWSYQLQGTGRFSNTTAVNPNTDPPRLSSEPGQDHRSARATFITQVRLIDEEAIPFVPPSHLGFGIDMMNLVFPIHYDRTLEGRADYDNIRAGVELWTKVFGLGFGGAAFLITVGYDFQYFHKIGKAMHLGQAALRLGWDQL